jgi:hypothetical protein
VCLTRIIVVVAVLTAAAAAQGFDPYEKQVVDYGVPKDFPGNPHHDQLMCFYCRSLMVKQLTNEWNKGALFLSFLRFDQTRPACVEEHSPAEKVLGYPEWGGYFRGLAKGDLVFFDAEDGQDGGMPFAVYDSKTQKKIFEDNAYYVWMWNQKLRPRPSPFNDIRVRTTHDGNGVRHPQQGGGVLAIAWPETRNKDRRSQLYPLGGEPDSWGFRSRLSRRNIIVPYARDKDHQRPREVLARGLEAALGIAQLGRREKIS